MTTITKQMQQAKAILIIGLGQTGLSCARFLVEHGANVAVMDTRQNPPCLAILQSELPQVLVTVGQLDSEIILQADMIVLSPGIDPRIPEIISAKKAGIEIVGDIELFSRYANAPIVAITGSNGKSTVTTLLAEMATEAGKRIQVGGNLGTPALDLITYPSPDFYIVELSSFQLETVQTLNAFVATVLNLTADHLDRYDNERQYKDAKSTIFNGDGVMILNCDDDKVMQLARAGRNQIGFSLHASKGVDFGVINQAGCQWLAAGTEKLLSVEDLKIKGKHNIANALAALALGSAMGLAMYSMLIALKNYQGLPHRCRLVIEKEKIRWFNDSKATNVGACIAAIDGLAESGKIILIAGGVGKDQNFSELVPAIEKNVRVVILLGQDADLIASIVPDNIVIHKVVTINEAVNMAKREANSGENVLLSPACASFDMFSGYAERGDAFEMAVKELV